MIRNESMVFFILVLFTAIVTVAVGLGAFVFTEMYYSSPTPDVVYFDEVKGFETTDCLLITNYKDFIQQDSCNDRPVIIKIVG